MTLIARRRLRTNNNYIATCHAWNFDSFGFIPVRLILFWALRKQSPFQLKLQSYIGPSPIRFGTTHGLPTSLRSKSCSNSCTLSNHRFDLHDSYCKTYAIARPCSNSDPLMRAISTKFSNSFHTLSETHFTCMFQQLSHQLLSRHYLQSQMSPNRPYGRGET